MALFFLYGQVSERDSDSRRITVTQAQVDSMVRDFRKSQNRPPSAAELSGLIDRYVRDEILYREGLVLGLDRDDAVIKRRVRQKYDLMAEEEDRAAPTDEELTAYITANPKSFVRPAVVSFDQIFFEPGRNSLQRASAARAALSHGAKAEALGDPSLLPARVNDSSVQLVTNDFGDEFARQVQTAPMGQWVGPLESSYGVHLLRVRHRASARLPRLEEVGAEALREWENDRRTRSRDNDYRKLRDAYQVDITARLPAAAAQ